jgi:TRAP-type C4-dicarboxylate transport system substrate-binding protein
MIKTAEGGSQALWDYIHKNAMDEYRGFKLIATHVSTGTQLHLGKKSVKSLEDLKGLKIRATSRLNAETLEALGAVPVQMPVTAVSEGISKGVVDGASIPWDITTAFKLEEICKTHTETGPNQPKHGNSIFVWAMNQAKYNRLPPELKKVIDHNSGIETSKWVGKTYADWVAPPRDFAISRHNTINTLTDAEFKRWVEATRHVKDGWIKEVNKKGGDGKALLNDAKALLKKYDR